MGRKISNALIESIYDAALDSNAWNSVILDIKEAFRSQAAGFFIDTKNNQHIEDYLLGIDPDEMGLYAEYYAEKNPWYTIPGLMTPGKVLTDYSLEALYKNDKAFSNTEFYQDWCKKQDFRHLMGGNLSDKDGNLLNFTFCRSHQAGHFSALEVAEYNALSRHLIRAVEINSKLNQSDLKIASSEAILSSLNIGVIVLGVSGRIEYMNEYAKTLILSSDGLFVHRSKVKAVSGNSHKALQHAIDFGYSKQRSSTVSIDREKSSPLSVTVMPASGKRGFLGITSRYISLLITDPDDRVIGNAEYLARRWNLTPVEAEFACNLLKGLSVNHTAEVMEFTKETARWYSKQVMRKLDVSSQSELIIKLMRDISFMDKL